MRLTSTSIAPSRARALRALLQTPKLECILEAHNAASALLVEQSEVSGIWASSLTLSCANGYRDNNTLCMSQVLDILESMTERTTKPILFDADTGYGDFAHTEVLARRLSARKIAGMCIEDKRLPKRNSFVESPAQQLADVDEFCGKLQAAREASQDDDFVIIARTEALIVGAGLEEALMRADRYVEAGADALLIHSKASDFEEISAFLARWRCERDTPIVCVPTTYSSTPTARMEAEGVSMVIWANYMLRAAVAAMRQVAQHISQTGSAQGLEAQLMLASVKDLFELQDNAGLLANEARFGAHKNQ